MNTTSAPAGTPVAAPAGAPPVEEKSKGFFDMLGSLFAPSSQTGGRKSQRKGRKATRKGRKATRKAASRRRANRK